MDYKLYKIHHSRGKSDTNFFQEQTILNGAYSSLKVLRVSIVSDLTSSSYRKNKKRRSSKKEFENNKSNSESDNIKIEEIELKNNTITSAFLQKYWDEKFLKMKKKIRLDIFDVLGYMSQEKLDRTIWIPNSEEPVKSDFMNEIERCENECIKEEKSHVGIPLFMRKKRGRKTGKKKEPVCKNIFIEFILPNSVNRMLKLAATAKFSIKGKNKKIFKAGTKPDYLVVKKRVQQ